MKNYSKHAIALFFISLLINIGTASADTAMLGINRDAVIKTTQTSITSGTHPSTIQYYMQIFDYTGSQTLGNISFSSRLSTNIADWGNKEYATVNGGNVDWLFPSTTSIKNNLEEIGVWFASNYNEMKYVGTDATINVVPVTFSSDGYQQVNLTVTYHDISDANWMWVDMWISEYDVFQASFVQSSLYSDAPVTSYEYHSKGVEFEIDPHGIILNKPYTFSAKIYVDINNSQVEYRPGINVGKNVGYSDASNPTPSYSAVVSLSQLRIPLNSASASTNLPLVWTVHTEDNILMEFEELFQTQGSINTPTITPTVTPTITPTPTVNTGVGGTVVSIANVTATADSNITRAIMVENVNNLAAATIWLTYDPNVVNVLSVSAGDLGGVTTNIDNTIGKVTMSAFSTTAKSGNVVFANVLLTAVGQINATSPLTLSVPSLADQNGVPIPNTLRSGTFTISSVIKGDVNGDGQVTIVDALFVAQYTVSMKTLSASQLAAADVNGDGQVTVVDALFIAQYTVGLRQL